jgi:hypothetical protein
MSDIYETLTLEDLCRIFHVAPVTIYRWTSEGRAGKTTFPVPLSGFKRKLLWSRDAILRYQNGGTPAPPQPESAKSRAKRNAVAMASLRRRGVNIKAKEGDV